MKTIETLVDDIYGLFTKEHDVNQENLASFSKNIAEILKNRLKEKREKSKPESLRMSKLGTPNRKLWFEMNEPVEGPAISPSNLIKFLYGDILEQLVILLAKEAGHVVEDEQGELEIDGVLGHKDCKIDGITTDIKSTSKFAFTKFERGTLAQDDPFGYIAQLSGYMYADKSETGSFLAINKETGQLALLKLNKVDTIDPKTRIKELRECVALKAPPEQKCYEPIAHGKSGNMVLASNCGYCPFKYKCWKDVNNGAGLRSFKYSDGIKHFTKIVDLPRVDEWTAH